MEPELPPDVRVDVIEGEQTYLSLDNPTSTAIFVLDPRGDSFLRVSRAGVSGDVGSPYLAASRDIVESASAAADGCCPEGQWRQLSKASRWAWPDPRLDPPLRDDTTGDGRGLAALSSSRSRSGGSRSAAKARLLPSTALSNDGRSVR